MNGRKIVCLFLFFLVIVLLVVPVSAALDRDTLPVSKDPLAENNPEIIAALKTHIAYVGQSQQARMDGVIAYIDRISGGNGTSSLRDIEDDYMETASSIPVMQTADEITEARGELRTQTQLFSEETKAQMVMFNGSTDDMRGAINASAQPMENSSSTLKESLWLAKDTARITVFNKESQERTALLSTISKQGIDTSHARNISEQIDTQRSAIQKALADNSARSLKAANSGLKSLNHQFRGVVKAYRGDVEIQMKQAAVLAMNQ
jgi:flagellar biosynthesis GTPase FlhF